LASAISRFITFSVDKTSLGGTPAAGWSFVLTLAGQDGFSPDVARAFEATPSEFQFALCAMANADPHCVADPATVPKVMDTFVPTGVTQQDELDYTVHAPPVVLHAVVMP
jgi:glucoamylase